MRTEHKSTQGAGRSRLTHKTREDFLRWLIEKDPHQKRMIQAKITQADNAISQALMVWVDDGGKTA